MTSKRIASLTAAAALVGAVMTVSPAPAMKAATCTTTVDVPGLGAVCPAPGGWLVPIADGSLRFTHGGDPVPSHLHGIPDSPPRDPRCIADPLSEYHGLAVYVHAADTPNRYAQMAGEVRDMVRYANGFLYSESSGLGRPMDYRFACTGGAITVANVTLPTPLQATDFQSVINDLVVQGYSSSLAKYWIWFDGRPPGAPGGTGTLANDTAPGPLNSNNYGPSWGVTWGFGLYNAGSLIMMHENGHNLGAVQANAPRSSGAGHCNDGRDVMCYADGGPTANYNPFVCSSLAFDCGYNDYFNPDPPPLSYLSNFWNLGSPNSFIQGCLYGGDRLVGRPGAVVEGENAKTYAVPSSCWGAHYAAWGVFAAPPVTFGLGLPGLPAPGFEGGGALTGSTVSKPAGGLLWSLDVCWLQQGDVLRCDEEGRLEAGRVPAGADAVRIIMRSNGPSQFIIAVM